MEHRAVVDRGGEIDRRATPRREPQLQREDMPLGVESDVVIDPEIVPLAGHRHVVVAVAAEFGGTPGLGRDQRGGGGEQRGLRLLAAERAAHPAHLDRDIGRAEPEHMRDEMLDFARMLGRAQQMDLAVLAGCRDRDLALEVEMVLPTKIEPARQAVRRGRQRCRRIAARHPLGRFDQRLRCAGIRDRQQGRARFVIDPSEPGSLARRGAAGRGDEEHRLPDAQHFAVREQSVVMRDRADVVRAGNVGGGVHRDHAGRGSHRGQVDGGDCGVRLRALSEGEVEHPWRLGPVVGIGRSPADMQSRAVVRRSARYRADGLGKVALSHRSSPDRAPRRFPLAPCATIGGADCPPPPADTHSTRGRRRAG